MLNSAAACSHELKKSRQFGCHRGKLREVRHQIRANAGKVTAGFVCIALYHAHGQVALPHDAVAGAGHLGGQHLVEFVTVLVQAVILVGQQNAALKLCLVDATVVNCDFCRRAGIKGVQQFRVIKEHTGFVLFASDGVVDVGERPRFGILVADLENAIRKNAADGDSTLYAARNAKLFAFHLLRFRQGFNQAVSSLSWVFFFIGKPLFRFMPARMAGCIAS